MADTTDTTTKTAVLNQDLLAVEVTGCKLVISIGLGSLQTALSFHHNMTEGSSITDMDAVTSALVGELKREEEDGSTPVHRMLDAAFWEAVEQGCEGVYFPEDEANCDD